MRTSSSRRCSVAMRALPRLQHLWLETIQSHQIHRCFWLVGSSTWQRLLGLRFQSLQCCPWTFFAASEHQLSYFEKGGRLYPTGRSQIWSSITNPGSMWHWTNPLKLCKIQWKESNSLSCPLISETIDAMVTSTLLQAKRDPTDCRSRRHLATSYKSKRDPTDCRSRRHLATSYKSQSSWPVDSNAHECCNVIVSKGIWIYKVCRAKCCSSH